MHLSKPIVPLLRLLHFPLEISAMACADLGIIADEHPELLTSHVHRFFIRADDLPFTALEKQRILCALAISAPEHALTVLHEFEECTRSADDTVVCGAVQAIGRVAAAVPECTMQCVSLLMQAIRESHRKPVSFALRHSQTLSLSQLRW